MTGPEQERELAEQDRAEDAGQHAIAWLAAELPSGSLRPWQPTYAALDSLAEALAFLDELSDYCKPVLVLSGDQIYRMDFRDVMRTHEEMHAEVTLAGETLCVLDPKGGAAGRGAERGWAPPSWPEAVRPRHR